MLVKKIPIKFIDGTKISAAVEYEIEICSVRSEDGSEIDVDHDALVAVLKTDELPDYTIGQMAKILSIHPNRAYMLRYHGEYRAFDGQKGRRVYRKVVDYRRANGLQVAISNQ